jgi:hypothetical protein
VFRAVSVHVRKCPRTRKFHIWLSGPPDGPPNVGVHARRMGHPPRKGLVGFDALSVFFGVVLFGVMCHPYGV